VKAEEKQEVLTGLLYLNTEQKNFLELLDTVSEPLASLPQERLRPSKGALDEIMEELR
jgi:2-oxoglutarate ferredoxin oxidoreductase subunit beta